MRRASARAAEKAAEKAVAGGGDGDAASAFARRVVQAQLRKATTAPSTRKHLHLTGEYQFQDVALSQVRVCVAWARGLLRGAGVADGSCACCPQPFEVNVGMVMNAYMRLSCNTGCRPGMAVSDAADGGDEAGPWYEVPPLCNRSITISPDGLRTPRWICRGTRLHNSDGRLYTIARNDSRRQDVTRPFLKCVRSMFCDTAVGNAICASTKKPL